MSKHLFLTVVVLAVANSPLTSGQTLECPPEEVMYPCECVSIVKYIRCQGANISSAEQVMETLDRISPYFEDSFVFQGFYLVDTELEEIPAGFLKFLKFTTVTIRNNHKLKYISPGALNGTKYAALELTAEHSNFNQNGSSTDWVFEFLREFPNLTKFVLLDAGISSIPDNALNNMTTLQRVEISQNPLFTIGSYPFSNLPNLTTLWLDNSFELTPEGINPNAFKNLSNPDIWIAFDWTDSLYYLPEESIKPIFDFGRRLSVGGEECIPLTPYCTHRKFICDRNIDWICDHPNFSILEGYYCKDSFFVNIDAYCVWAKNNSIQKL